MQQEINLLREIPLTPPLIITLPRVISVAIGFLIILWCYYFFSIRSEIINFNDHKQKLLTDKQNAQIRLIVSQKKQIDFPSEDILTTRVNTLKDQIDNQKLLLNEAKNLVDKRSTAYDTIFTTLAEVSIKGLWLEHIRLANTDLLLQGRTYSQNLVTQYVSLLSQKSAMNKFHFKILSSSQNSDIKQPLSFVLSTASSVEP